MFYQGYENIFQKCGICKKGGTVYSCCGGRNGKCRVSFHLSCGQIKGAVILLHVKDHVYCWNHAKNITNYEEIEEVKIKEEKNVEGLEFQKQKENLISLNDSIGIYEQSVEVVDLSEDTTIAINEQGTQQENATSVLDTFSNSHAITTHMDEGSNLSTSTSRTLVCLQDKQAETRENADEQLTSYVLHSVILDHAYAKKLQ